MAILNSQGMSVSYDSAHLIKSLKKDIKIGGLDMEVTAYFKEIDGAAIAVNYRLRRKGFPEVLDETVPRIMRAGELLKNLEEQHSIT